LILNKKICHDKVMRKPELRYKLARNFTLMGANEFLAALRLFYPISILYFSEITGSLTTAQTDKKTLQNNAQHAR